MKKDDSLTAIPVSVIEPYLKDYFSGSYKGVGLLGIMTANLNSPFQKKYYGIDEDMSGEMIAISQNSPLYGKVKEKDVLLKIGKYKLNTQGKYKNSKWGWLSFKDIAINYKAGDSVDFSVLRGGKVVNVTTVLTKYDPEMDAIVQNPHSGPNYYIFGGLVFQELSIDYVKTWGRDWIEKALLHILREFYTTMKVT